MDISARSGVVIFTPTREGQGTSYHWRRTIGGIPYSFQFVMMPNGERRHFIRKYNGYCAESVASGLMDLAKVLRFDCAWSPVHSLTVRA